MSDFEPYKIKMVQAITPTTKNERSLILKNAHYNLFKIPARSVTLDLLTDSGTGAMSDRQWAQIMLGDEAYAGSESFEHLENFIQTTFDYRYVVPCHQGRAAEHLLFPVLASLPRVKTTKRPCFLSNYHFDTSAAHVELAGCDAINCLTDEALSLQAFHPFKGNMNLEMLRREIKNRGPTAVVAVLITVTCNSVGGQPVSMSNIKAVADIARHFNIPLIIDAARLFENAFFIQKREEGYRQWTIEQIARKTLSFADAFTMSCKKDGLVNIGGLCCIRRDKGWYQAVAMRCIPYEGYLTYGGLAGRDLAALTQGLQEGMSKSYLAHRVGQVEQLGLALQEIGVPIQYPTGGHAVFVDAAAFLPHIPPAEFPAQVLANALYVEAGVRGVEIGSFLLGKDPVTGKQKPSPYEFLRLTIPRRTYTWTQLRAVVDAFARLKKKKKRKLVGFKN